MVTVKRRVEVFTAGCPVCTEVVGLVRDIACPNCEVRVYDLRDGCATNECREKATRYGVTAVPVKDGEVNLIPLPTRADPNAVQTLELKLAKSSKTAKRVQIAAPIVGAPACPFGTCGV